MINIVGDEQRPDFRPLRARPFEKLDSRHPGIEKSTIRSSIEGVASSASQVPRHLQCSARAVATSRTTCKEFLMA
jgi:hypothetical protein